MPKAKSRVPTPTTPPKHHPTATTVSSMALRTHAMGRFVLLCKPVINPSLGPGPRLAIRYNPPPKPVTVTPTIPSIIFKPSWSNSGRYGRVIKNQSNYDYVQCGTKTRSLPEWNPKQQNADTYHKRSKTYAPSRHICNALRKYSPRADTNTGCNQKGFPEAK